jgi:hypothetical protein
LRTYPSESEANHTIGSASEKCAFTIWNVAEWLFNSMDPAIRAKFNDWKSFVSHIESASPELKLCHEVTTRDKHHTLEHKYWTDSAQVTDAMLSAPLAWPTNSSSTMFRPKIKTDMLNLEAINVYRKALQFWDEFFQQWRIK